MVVRIKFVRSVSSHLLKILKKLSGCREALHRAKSVSAAIPICLVLAFWPHNTRVFGESRHLRAEKALGDLRRAFDSRDQADAIFQPAFLKAQRSILAISPAAARWWSMDPDLLVKQEATPCIAYLQSYREDLRAAELSLDAAQGTETDNTKFDSALVDADQQTQGIIRCMAAAERHLH
jgi:hypothetical protein